MGSIGSFRAATLWPPADPDAEQIKGTITKWTSFYRHYRAIRPSGEAGLIISDLIHLRRPDSRSISSVMHVSADTSAPERALLILINPTPRNLTDAVAAPLYYAGLTPGTHVQVSDVTPTVFSSFAGLQQRVATRHTVGKDAADYTSIAVDVSLRPRSYMALEISLVTS